MSSSKKFTCEGTLRMVYLSQSPSPPMTPYPPPLTHCMPIYCILIHSGKGGGELTREKVRGATAHEAGSKILYQHD